MRAVAHYTKIRTMCRINLLIIFLFVALKLPAHCLNIGDYGAKADGTTNKHCNYSEDHQLVSLFRWWNHLFPG